MLLFSLLCFQGKTVASRGKQSLASATATKRVRSQRFGWIRSPHACGSGGDLPRCRAFPRRLLQASSPRSHLCGWVGVSHEFTMRAKLWTLCDAHVASVQRLSVVLASLNHQFELAGGRALRSSKKGQNMR